MKRRCTRLLSLLCALALCAGTLLSVPFTVSAAKITETATAINAVRGEGQLIIYTPEFGATTNTNEWGVEAVVGADHKVTQVGKNNCAIPQGGFVLSGHDTDVGPGRMKTWILENVHVGDYVYYNANSLIVTVSDKPLSLSSGGFYEIDYKYSATNQPRYENLMIVYTPAFGATTRTNEYGTEVVVQDEMVVSIGGNNSTIPKNGFVISGHGTGESWLLKNVKLGMRVKLNTSASSFTLIFNAESLEKGLKSALDLLAPKIEQAKKSYLYMDYNAFDKEYQSIKTTLSEALAAHKRGGSDDDLVAVGTELQDRIIKLTRTITESYPVQYRAVWLRPSQKSAEEVDAYVKTLADAGINTVCVEGIFDNTVIMNVPKGCLFEHNPSFNYDVLQAYIDACKKYNMECHLWMAIFLVGNTDSKHYSRSVAYKKPEWINKDQTGKTSNEYRFCMIDPANEEARAYLLNFYTYILQTYDINCFQLDYIRYYDRMEAQDFGYTDAAFKGFEETYHHGVKPTYDQSASYWNDWVNYRKSCVTALVRGMREIIDTYKPNVLLSADVVPNVAGAGANNYQDYPQWLKEGLLDLLHPMAYGDGFDDNIKQQIQLAGDRCMVVTGLGVFTETLGADDMARQAIDNNGFGAYGHMYFEASTYLKDNAGEALMASSYRTPAIAPFLDRDNSIKVALQYMDSRITDILLPMGGLTASEAASIRDAIQKAISSVKNAVIAPSALDALFNQIGAVSNAEAKARLREDLLRAERISCTTYHVDRHKLFSELSKPDGQEFPDHSEPFDPDNSAATDPSVSGGTTTPGGSTVSGSGSGADENAGESGEQAGSTEDGSSLLWLWIVIAAVVVIAGAVIVVLVLRKKQGKTNA